MIEKNDDEKDEVQSILALTARQRSVPTIHEVPK